jgi:hypothetical protein
VTAEQQPQQLDPEERARRAETALEAALAERNRLWEALHRRTAHDREVEYYKGAYEQLVNSRSWRLTAPLRSGRWLAQQVPELGRRLRRFVAARPRTH